MTTACRPLFFSAIFSIAAVTVQAQQKADVWLTDPVNHILFQQQPVLSFTAVNGGTGPVIEINDQQKYQQIDGFGFALTGGSAQHIHNMSKAARAALLQELFATKGNAIGTSYLRLSIGASDLDERVFSYNDLTAGETDTTLAKFDLGHDKIAVIPVVKEILAINPKIKILGSPWSAPVWMKTNNDTRGGSLKPEYYAAYAKYFVKYIQAMKKEGIRIDAITVQNEPLHPGNNPSMFMPAPDQAVFVRDHLGPAFKQARLDTKIIIYDHNADKPDYPISILNDEKAKQYIDGSAFHLYGGKIDALSEVHNAHPDKNLYFTEQWVGAPGNMRRDIAEHVRNLIIGATRNWSRNVIEWNLAANSANQPHTDRGGCDRCLGGVTIDQDSVKRNPAYYIIAHAAKFVRPGSVRIASNTSVDLPNVAFKTPQGKTVLIVLNDSKATAAFNVKYKNKNVAASLPAGATATYIF
ncbi:MAG: glycoside hydrolase family 30 beta sandwich domain-containing protein [Chitinophagaceae bacterium]